MLDTFRSLLFFFRANKGSVVLLTSSLSLIFLACLVLHSLSRVEFLETDASKEYSSMYEITYLPANQNATDHIVSSINQADMPVDEMNIHGEVELLTSDGMKVAFPLIGFENSQTMPIQIYRGSSLLSEDDVLVDEWTYDDAMPCTTSDDGNEFLLLANGERRHIAGIVFIPWTLDYNGVVVKMDEFFSITESSTSLQVVFSCPLTLEEEEQWISEVSRYVNLVEVKFPSNYLEPIEQGSSIQTFLSRFVIVFILLCSMRLMTYLFMLRKQELSVIRMLGANNLLISLYITSMILTIGGISVIIGTIGYKIIIFTQVIGKFLPSLSLDLILSDVVFFISVTFVIGIATFLLNTKVDVTRVSEEV